MPGWNAKVAESELEELVGNGPMGVCKNQPNYLRDPIYCVRLSGFVPRSWPSAPRSQTNPGTPAYWQLVSKPLFARR